MMFTKIIVLVSIGCLLIFRGVKIYRKGLISTTPYDFGADVRDFFKPHIGVRIYPDDGMPRRMGPILLVLGGLGIMVIGILKIV